MTRQRANTVGVTNKPEAPPFVTRRHVSHSESDHTSDSFRALFVLIIGIVVCLSTRQHTSWWTAIKLVCSWCRGRHNMASMTRGHEGRQGHGRSNCATFLGHPASKSTTKGVAPGERRSALFKRFGVPLRSSAFVHVPGDRPMQESVGESAACVSVSICDFAHRPPQRVRAPPPELLLLLRRRGRRRRSAAAGCSWWPLWAPRRSPPRHRLAGLGGT